MNQLYYGDNLQVLREHIADESVDLIYLDLPFTSKRNYSLLFKSPKGVTSEAQIEAFEDTWRWNEQADVGQIRAAGKALSPLPGLGRSASVIPALKRWAIL